MYPNGITHVAVQDDLGGIASIVKWLSYIPKRTGAPVPVYQNIQDDPERDIAFNLGGKYDTRHMLAGRTTAAGEPTWVGGFFDKDSFMETLGGWGKTVVTGRARLGGIPVGVIAVETLTVERVVPADPADARTHEEVLAQPAQVWFPDSSYKTAQAIQDFNNGEQLPLIIFANWRGFSGGMRDMFNEILKFGSMIVDNLRKYKQPVFVYLPPGAELRGGAWVVLDSTINPDMMEMYADDNSRGGVLEPSGAVEIKYRDRDLIKTMHRLDDKLKELDSKLADTTQDGEKIKASITAREKELLPFYQMMSLKFADLHDTPGRMKEKGVIREVVPWKSARRYFFHRLRRRLAEESLCARIAHASPGTTHANAIEHINAWRIAAKKNAGDAETDASIADALENAEWTQARISELRGKWIVAQMLRLRGEDAGAFQYALAELQGQQ